MGSICQTSICPSVACGGIPWQIHPSDCHIQQPSCIPPSRFIRIRHYGILSSTSKKVTIPSIRQQFGTPEISFIDLCKLHSFNIGVCPCCGSLSMVTVQIIPSRNKKVRIVVTRKKVSFNNVFIVRATHPNENLTISGSAFTLL